jgi:hypothetical protein
MLLIVSLLVGCTEKAEELKACCCCCQCGKPPTMALDTSNAIDLTPMNLPNFFFLNSDFNPSTPSK